MWAGGMGTSFGWYRYLDPRGSWEEEWQTWSVQDETDYVTDDTWVKSEVQEKAEGVVDWKALEGNYLLAEQRFNVFGPNKKAGGRNSEEDLRKQLELLGDAKKKKEKQKTSKEPQRAEELGPSGQTSNTGIDDYQALLKSMEEENKARLRKIRIEQDESIALADSARRKKVRENLERISRMPEGKQRDKARKKLPEEQRKSLDAWLLFQKKSMKSIHAIFERSEAGKLGASPPGKNNRKSGITPMK
jgi:hypothetical protein